MVIEERKKFTFILALSAIIVCTGCKVDTDSEFDKLSSSVIEGLTVHNYPKVDGSTSTEPLNAIIACKLFGVAYKWTGKYDGTRYVEPSLNKNDTSKFLKLFKSSHKKRQFRKSGIDGNVGDERFGNDNLSRKFQ